MMNSEISPNQALQNLSTYFKWRKSRAEKLISFSAEFVNFNHKKILEIGCGMGPVAANLTRKSSRIFAVDPSIKALKLLRKFNPSRNITTIKGSNERIPVRCNYFDIIFSFDSFEHVKNPAISMKELSRVLKNGGSLIIETTPYYSLIAGHHLYNFSILPAQYLPRKFIKWWLWRKKARGIRTPQEAWQTFINLNRLKISTIKQLVKANRLTIKAENFIFKIPPLEIKINWIKHLGWLKEILPMSYQLVLQKNQIFLETI